MNTQLKVTKIGNSAGVVLPKELLARLRGRGWRDDLRDEDFPTAFG